MSEFGFMGVDWEERIDFGRMRRERLQRAKDAMEKAGADLLFIFALEDVRYLTGFRSHLGPVALLGMAGAVLPRGGEPLLCTHDIVHSPGAHALDQTGKCYGPPLYPHRRRHEEIRRRGEGEGRKTGRGKDRRGHLDLRTLPMAAQVLPQGAVHRRPGGHQSGQDDQDPGRDGMPEIANMITEAGFQALLDQSEAGGEGM